MSSPEQESAVMAAQGPGMAVTLISFSMQAWTSFVPGSEIPGVPASEMRAITFPFLRSSMMAVSFDASLNLWKLLRGVGI